MGEMNTVCLKGLFTLTYLIILMHFPSVISVKQTSVRYRIVQSASTKPLLEKRVKCAIGAMHHAYAAVRIAEGSGVCEKLTDAEMTTLGLEVGFEYLQKKSIVKEFKPDLLVINGETLHIHYPYSEVKVGDVFQFVLKKSGSERFYIRFKSADDFEILIFAARTHQLVLNTRTTRYGAEIIPPYPFSAFKQYIILFEILEAYWQVIKRQEKAYPLTEVFVVSFNIGSLSQLLKEWLCLHLEHRSP